MVRLSFHGAAETVTGSKYLLEADGARVLIDCGLFQGLKRLRELNWQHQPFDAAGIQGVVLTHAHIDHSGQLPLLVKQGFRGPIYCTGATAELTEILLLDSSEAQVRDAEYANHKGFSKHKPALPLYNRHDAARVIPRLQAIERKKWLQLAGPIWFRLLDVGHLLGASMVEVEIRNQTPPLRILFSGDVGRFEAPLYFDPTPPPACDFLICESTYGDRLHPRETVLDQLTEVMRAAIARGGVILVPAFAVGRAQQLIYLLRVLIDQGRLPELPVYLDSPMAIDATAVYQKYSAEHDLAEGRLAGPESVFAWRNVHLVRSVGDSKQLNSISESAVIISSSGMLTGGRILHHVAQRVDDPRNTILLGGYMAEGTRGRALQNGSPTIRIYGRDFPVRAAVVPISSLSGHADRDELLRWLAPLPAPRQVFLTHGEKASAMALAEQLRAQHGWPVTIPHLGQSVELTTSGG
jgi:metallo-beta-lactamase family protein